MTRPKAIFVFTLSNKGHTTSVGHDQSGRVELTYDNQLVSGRTHKILDNGIKLNFDADGFVGRVTIYPYLFTFR